MQSQCAFDDDNITSRHEEAFKRSTGVEAVELKILERKGTVPAATTLSTTVVDAREDENRSLPLFSLPLFWGFPEKWLQKGGY